jgi:hypothetical protein
MTAADTVRRLLVDAAGESLCDACLAFACSVSLSEMRQLTEELLTRVSFHRRDRCVSCSRTVPAIAYSAKCVHCSRAVLPGSDALDINGDLFHAACLKLLSSNESVRSSRTLSRRSQRLIEEAQRRMRGRPEERRQAPD